MAMQSVAGSPMYLPHRGNAAAPLPVVPGAHDNSLLDVSGFGAEPGPSYLDVATTYPDQNMPGEIL